MIIKDYKSISTIKQFFKGKTDEEIFDELCTSKYKLAPMQLIVLRELIVNKLDFIELSEKIKRSRQYINFTLIKSVKEIKNKNTDFGSEAINVLMRYNCSKTLFKSIMDYNYDLKTLDDLIHLYKSKVELGIKIDGIGKVYEREFEEIMTKIEKDYNKEIIPKNKPDTAAYVLERYKASVRLKNQVFKMIKRDSTIDELVNVYYMMKKNVDKINNFGLSSLLEFSFIMDRVSEEYGIEVNTKPKKEIDKRTRARKIISNENRYEDYRNMLEKIDCSRKLYTLLTSNSIESLDIDTYSLEMLACMYDMFMSNEFEIKGMDAITASEWRKVMRKIELKFKVCISDISNSILNPRLCKFHIKKCYIKECNSKCEYYKGE